MTTVRNIALATMLSAALVSTSTLANADDEPTREFSSPYTSLRLLNAGKQADVWRSGVYITMPKGWKTYWRVPGDGGVPPSFDWSGSENVATTSVMMPLPHRFTDANGEGIGYKTEVVFPVDVMLKDPSKPARLDLKIFYAVCNDICVPVQATVRVDMDASTVSAADEFRLRVARAAVPIEPAAGRLEVTSLKQVDVDGKRALEVSMTGIKSPAEADIFVEADGSSYFRKPRLISESGNTSTWRIAIDKHGEAVSLAGKPVRLTISDGDTGLVHEGVLQ